MTAPLQPAIEVRNVVKSFGSMRAIDDVSLSVAPGVFLTLLGPSGCGKSTLLRTIAGFITSDSGSVLIGGRDVTSLPPNARPVNMVFQDYALFPHMTVRENVGFGCEMQGLSRQAREKRVDDLLNLVQLPQLGHRRPDELSGGQRQRIALARALAPDPVSLLLDEPLGALDLKLRLEMQRELKSLQRKTGKTFVFVTHDQEEAMSMSDLIAVMRDGHIEQLDRPEVIYSRPVSLYVGSFVGAANLLEATVDGVDGEQMRVVSRAFQAVLPRSSVTTPGDVTPGMAVTLLVRPEHLQASTPAAGGLSLAGRVSERTYLGNRVHVRFETEDGRSLLADARAEDVAEVGEVFKAALRPESVAVLRS
ncbi:ABC transporter ATP-binding protein [Mesorhizobium sp. ZMM04-5]|uniref:ABC transporter ATP-binding protein n=1 Tax=Mesorhizobium marinum TaxID=3228790 RepID=A0ABV3QZS9_9HYPH